MPEPATFTVAQLAARWQCRIETVLNAIANRRLAAFSVGKPGARRPTWRIPFSAVEAFERGDRPAPPPKPAPRRRRRMPPNVIEFF